MYIFITIEFIITCNIKICVKIEEYLINIDVKKKKMFANFFARAKKLVVDCFLTLSFNLVILDFIDDERLLKTTTTTTIFLKNFFVLVDLLIATTTREVKETINNKIKIKKNVNYTNILKALQFYAN